MLSCPFTRGDVVCVRGEFDRQITHIHGAAIPLQPETQLLRPHTIFGQGIGPEIVPLLTYPCSVVRRWLPSPTSRGAVPVALVPPEPDTQRNDRYRPCVGYGAPASFLLAAPPVPFPRLPLRLALPRCCGYASGLQQLTGATHAHRGASASRPRSGSAPSNPTGGARRAYSAPNCGGDSGKLPIPHRTTTGVPAVGTGRPIGKGLSALPAARLPPVPPDHSA